MFLISSIQVLNITRMKTFDKLFHTINENSYADS